jgi:hypothetical protein
MRPDEERARTLRARAASWREEGLIDRDRERTVVQQLATPPWRSNGLFASIVFFGLTCIGVAAFGGFFEVLDLSPAIAGIMAIALAELLIRRQHWWGTGVESALWLAGLYTCIFALPGDGKPEAILLFAAAAIVAGVRVRNPFFGALAAILIVAYLGVKDWHFAALATGIAITLTALAALAREWQRPSTEWLWIALLVSMPPTAYLSGFAFFAWSERHPANLAIAVYGALAVVLLVAGRLLRHHAPFAAAAICAIIVAIEVRELFDYPIEAKLAGAGAFLLITSWLIHRALRDRTAGLVITPASITGADDLLEIGATLITAPASATQPAAEGRVQGDGRFGGAGATGDY